MEIKNANIAEKLTASQIDATNLKVAAANITGTLTASQIDATNLKVASANITGTITAGSISVKDSDGDLLLSAGSNEVSIAGWNVDNNSFYYGSSFSSATCFICTGSNTAMSIGGSESISGWVLKAGSKFGVTSQGSVWCSDLHATAGSKIGGWYISGTGALTSSNTNEYDEVENTVYMETERLFYMYNQSAGSAVFTRWETVINAAIDWDNTNSSESDKDVKNSIATLEDAYEAMFDGLSPCKYKYNHGTSDRFHTGFIAQEVVEAIEAAGMTTQDFAGVVRLKEPNHNGCQWLLRRDEFVSLNTWQIQKLKARIAILESKLNTLLNSES